MIKDNFMTKENDPSWLKNNCWKSRNVWQSQKSFKIKGNIVSFTYDKGEYLLLKVTCVTQGSEGEDCSRNLTWWIIRQKSESHPHNHQSWTSNRKFGREVRYLRKIRRKERLKILQKKFPVVILLCFLWGGLEEIL